MRFFRCRAKFAACRKKTDPDMSQLLTILGVRTPIRDAGFDAPARLDSVIPVLWPPETSWQAAIQAPKTRGHGNSRRLKYCGCFMPKCRVMTKTYGNEPSGSIGCAESARYSGASYSVVLGSFQNMPGIDPAMRFLRVRLVSQ